MKGSLRDYMKVGIVQFMIYPECLGGGGPQVKTLASLATNPAFDFIEVGPVPDPVVRLEMISILRQARVEAVFDGQPATLLTGLDLESGDGTQREKAITAMKAAIDQAAEFGSSTCGVMSGRAYPPGLDRAQATDRLVDSLRQLCRYAEPLGINMCLENFDSVPYSKNCLIGPTWLAAELSMRVREECGNFGLLLDLSHAPIMRESPREMVEAGGEQLIRTQIGNCSTNPNSSHYGDNHPYFGAALTDVTTKDLAEFLSALEKSGFLARDHRGLVGFEVKPQGNENPEAIIAGSLRILEEAWTMAGS